jgi:hypothetical protein
VAYTPWMSARSRRASAAWTAVAWLVLAACSSDEPGGGQGEGGPGPDTCGALEAREAGGEAVLGTGYEAFEALGDELAIIAGPQGGFHLNLNARIRGLEFGSVDDLLDPNNPSTAFAVYGADTDERRDMAECAVRLGYRPEQADEFGVLQRGVSVILDVASETELEPLLAEPARLEVDIVDAEGRYTRDQRTVTLRPPSGPPVPP